MQLKQEGVDPREVWFFHGALVRQPGGRRVVPFHHQQGCIYGDEPLERLHDFVILFTPATVVGFQMRPHQENTVQPHNHLTIIVA